MKFKTILFVVGPTAVGKTQVAFYLAKKLDGEIISCDAMQVYKEISIISNKPPKRILEKISHHLIDVVSITKDFNVAGYSKKALKVIAMIHRKGKIPILVGGSGLYISILLDGIFKEGSKDIALREKLEKKAAQKGRAFLYKELQKRDPKAALKIHPNDQRRIIRALEVFLSAKKPISELQKKRKGLWGKYDIQIFALNRDREQLYDLINRRVDQMIADGAIEEIERLRTKKWSKTAKSIIGVKEIMGYLNNEYDLERALYLIKLNTRHLAKRQLTWFRKDKRLQWITINKEDIPIAVAHRINKEIHG